MYKNLLEGFDRAYGILKEDAARVEPLNKNSDVEKQVFNDINAQLTKLRPSQDYNRYYDKLISSAQQSIYNDYWYLEDNSYYYDGYVNAKQNLVLNYKGYNSVEKERLEAIAKAIKNIGGKYINIKYGKIYFYLDLAKYFEKYRQAKHQAEETRKNKLMSIDIEKYRPSDALISKARQYYMTNNTRFVGKIDNIDTYLTYYYLSTLLNWSDLYDVVRNKADSLDTYKYSDIEDAIDLKVKPEKIDRGNSGFVSNFSNVVKFCIDNNIQWKATSRKATSHEYEKDLHNGRIYTIAYDFEVNGNVLPVAIHTNEGGGRPYGYMINGIEVNNNRQATALIISWIKNVTNNVLKESFEDTIRCKTGTCYKFATKKEVDAQRKAMFARGFKESVSREDVYDKMYDILDEGIISAKDLAINLMQWLSSDELLEFVERYGYDEIFADEDLDEKCSKKSLKEDDLNKDLAKYQKWVDYDMKRYGRISDNTKSYLKKAGLEIVKDQYGSYEVIANTKSVDEAADLSQINGTSTKALQDNIKKINSATTPGEVYNKTVEVLEMSGINTNSPSISKMLNRLQRARTLESAFSIVYNSLLKGSNLGVR